MNHSQTSINMDTFCNSLPYILETKLNCIMCIVASICSLIAGFILFVHYYFSIYSNILRNAFNDVFVALVIVQVIQATQLLIFSFMTIMKGEGIIMHMYTKDMNNMDDKTTENCSSLGMTFIMCNINASFFQYLDAASQCLLVLFFIVLSNSRRLTSLERLESGYYEGIIHTNRENSYIIPTQGRSADANSEESLISGTMTSPSHTSDIHNNNDNNNGGGVVFYQHIRKIYRFLLYRFQNCGRCVPFCFKRRQSIINSTTTTTTTATTRTIITENTSLLSSALPSRLWLHDIESSEGVVSNAERHTLFRITWKIYLITFLYTSFILLLCWLILAYVPGLIVKRYVDKGSEVSYFISISNSLFFTQKFAWCWIPNPNDLSSSSSSSSSLLQKGILLLLQVITTYISPLVFIITSTYAYCALKRCSPSLLHDHPVVFWRIVISCAYPTCVIILEVIARFTFTITSSSSSSLFIYCVHVSLLSIISFMYPFSAVINVILFLYTEKMLNKIILIQLFKSCFLYKYIYYLIKGIKKRNNNNNNLLETRIEFGSDTIQDEYSSSYQIYRNSVIVTMGFCTIVKAIACSTVTGLPPFTASCGFENTGDIVIVENENNCSVSKGE